MNLDQQIHLFYYGMRPEELEQLRREGKRCCPMGNPFTCLLVTTTLERYKHWTPSQTEFYTGVRNLEFIINNSPDQKSHHHRDGDSGT